MPDIFLKDLSFKLIKKTNPAEPSIPDFLQAKLTELQNIRKQLLNAAEQLKANGSFDETSISLLCDKLGVVSYHNLEQSFGNDHPYSYYYDNDTNTLFFSQNSVQHIAYDFEAHFKDGNKVDVNDLKELYSDLDNLVYIEMYKLLALRDGIEIKREEIRQLSKQDKIGFIKNHLKTNRTSSNQDSTFTLSKEDIAIYFNTILRSKELAAINVLLKKPFNLSEESFITAQLESLLSDKNLAAYRTGIDKIINTIYQALSPNRAKPGEQTIALNGNGFLPFRTSKSELIPLAKIEAIQIDFQIEALNKLHEQYPKAMFVVAMIEANGQEHKCEIIRQTVERINLEAKKSSPVSIGSSRSSLFNQQPMLDKEDTSKYQYGFN
ncbi:Uncharacterised protein [Legionella busanensis]|uniref:Uncharacterized protein n=1 Tax=Legionella busanensis TaxID=190655 RepID=A0A378JM22_9GAMM|nr:hypothetical protein [Legionella busanensis]STX51130.1 Uncharacterised protein [Legionella busanensis]